VAYTNQAPTHAAGKKFVAAGLQTRPFAAPHKNEDRPHLQVNNTTKTLSGGPTGGAYPHFCEGLQTAWFAARLQQIFFLAPRLSPVPLCGVDPHTGYGRRGKATGTFAWAFVLISGNFFFSFFY
jgi:hypothetical protein